ncbi:hypothetical protein [Pelagicoccus sp. SDUM812002]|uniref:hypothetical protein n=1 Tax=Pelagicoccus sp. SDUM812002 TaxID=3041266 RepID=UPI00280CCCA2|nr:hypothetical protein [Pelagicoccus sp. SDUM812002]MDQ8186783.1 hypothetical protein [Pelagicoccus sp. SDUM812002]
MPVSYRYSSESRIVEITCSGELTIDEIMKYFSDLRDDTSIPPGAIELVDLSLIGHFNVDFQGASAMPSGYKSAQESKEIRATILFGMNRLNQGLASLIQAHFLHTLPHHPFHLAVNEREARALADKLHADCEEETG